MEMPARWLLHRILPLASRIASHSRKHASIRVNRFSSLYSSNRYYYIRMPIEQKDKEVILTLPSDESTSVKILLHGANILSWTIAGKEQLWLSEGAILDGSKAVRGGVPLVFPVFGKAGLGPTSTLPQHGFARLSTWEFLGQVSASPLTVQFGLGPENVSDAFRKAWDFDFTLIYTIALGEDTLETAMRVENTSKVNWDFQILFHTYFRIPDLDKVEVNGLTGVTVKDKVSKSDYSELNNSVTVTSETDRVYENVNNDVLIASAGKALFHIYRKNVADVVVWNPWVNASKNMGDFRPEDGYKSMICVEAGSVSKWTTLCPGQTWECSEKIKSLL
ncbi:galactose mutarotase-like domain-containing protein [Lipomyces chichibuensis]|uniref:galactose mutarotase-like domain-containing protein n=1 Tax=Lipomyces chichibuensis TaxID=1546026 RepID=UPI00334301FB